MDDLRGRQQLYNGFGDTLARGFEIAVIPILFGFFGWFLDRRLDTMPVLTIVFAVFALVGMAVRTYFAYESEMQAHDVGTPWSREHAAHPADRDRNPPR